MTSCYQWNSADIIIFDWVWLITEKAYGLTSRWCDTVACGFSSLLCPLKSSLFFAAYLSRIRLLLSEQYFRLISHDYVSLVFFCLYKFSVFMTNKPIRFQLLAFCYMIHEDFKGSAVQVTIDLLLSGICRKILLWSIVIYTMQILSCRAQKFWWVSWNKEYFL